MAGAALGAALAFISRRQHALSPGGAWAALAVAVACTTAGWAWAIVLVAFFVSANVLSRYRAGMREERIGAIVEKGAERDAWQVAANGAVFTGAAIASVIHPSGLWIPLAAGAIAASTADTWSTEIGTVAAGAPRLITTGRAVPVGTSGGVSWPGSLTGAGGAAFIAVTALLIGWGGLAAAAALAGGVAGMLVDSVAGASIQRRQWCARCGEPTERLMHSCGTGTERRGGMHWVNNDAVNLLSSVTGAIVGSILYCWLPSL